VGITLDIGTSIGGHEIAQAIDVSGGGSGKNVSFAINSFKVNADAYLYATLSGNYTGNLYILYPVMDAYTNSFPLELNPTQIGKALIKNCVMLGYGGTYFKSPTTSLVVMENCRFDAHTYSIYATESWSSAPIYFSHMIGVSGTNNLGNLIGKFNVIDGYIAPGEIHSVSGSLTAGNANAIGFAWHNPELQDIYIKKVVITVTTGGGTAGSHLDVGIADDATYTNGGTEFFNDLLLNSVQVNDSTNAADGGNQTKWVFCQDSVSATDGWVVGKILDANAASLVGSYYIEYVGK
jgi:hypothetical protein